MRYAKENEHCLTLDEENRECTKDMIVISDDKQLHGIGGVMGGLDSGCSLDTKNVFLEVALFDPVSVTKTGRHLKLQSDARYRFERGLDPYSIDFGLNLATKMILDFCGGEASKISMVGSYKQNLKKTKKVIGNNTTSAVRAGFFWGYVGLIDNIIQLIKKESKKPFNIIITGGFSKLLSPKLKIPHTLDIDLTLKGMIFIYESNN